MGEITHMIAGFLGENTNNVAEITSLLNGLQVATQHHLQRLIIEGDSQIIIQLISKILHGHPRGVAPPVGDSQDFWRILKALYTPI
jgi:ribonuclease HI